MSLVRSVNGRFLELAPDEEAAERARWQVNETIESAERARTDIDTSRDARIFGGVEYMGRRFDSDPRSIQNLTGTLAAVQAGAFALPVPFYWRSADNVNVAMTLDDIKGLAAAMIGAGYAAYLDAWAAKDAL